MPCIAWQRRTKECNKEKSLAHLRLIVFHFVQLCFVAEAWVTGSVWAVDGNNIGLFVKDIVFCFRTLFFSIVHHNYLIFHVICIISNY